MSLVSSLFIKCCRFHIRVVDVATFGSSLFLLAAGEWDGLFRCRPGFFVVPKITCGLDLF